MTKRELKREREARKYWRRRAKSAEKALRASQNRVMLRWSGIPGAHRLTIEEPPEEPVRPFVPTTFMNQPMPSAGPGWPAIGDIICGAK